VILAGIAVAAVLGARQVYFLGTDEGGRLALYRGLPYELPFDISLYNEVLSSPTQIESLPEDRRDEATNHEWRSRDDAVDLLDDLEQAARALTTTEDDTAPQGEQDQAGGQAGNRAGNGQGGARNGGGGAGAQAGNQ
jgi:hypothetical protein